MTLYSRGGTCSEYNNGDKCRWTLNVAHNDTSEVVSKALFQLFYGEPVRPVIHLEWAPQSVTTEFFTQLNSVMNGLIELFFTSNCPIAQLTEHKTEYLKRSAGVGSNARNFTKTFVLIFTK